MKTIIISGSSRSDGDTDKLSQHEFLRRIAPRFKHKISTRIKRVPHDCGLIREMTKQPWL
jgi:hypothetical protein